MDGAQGTDARRRSRVIHLFAPGTDLRERYDVLEGVRAPRGGVVYRALDRARGHEVTLRLIPTAALASDELLRLRRSLAVLRRAVPDPRLPRILEVRETVDALYVATEPGPSATLRERLAQGGLAVPEALTIAGEVLYGLHALHELGLLHLNLRPGNVLLGDALSVRLAEAALPAPWRDDAPLDEKAVDGEDPALYVSPEQARGLPLDARSDLYSAGVLLFELLTGHLPFEGLGSVETALAHVKAPVPDVRALRRAVPRWLAAVLKRMLAKDPERRYSTALEVLADLDARRASKVSAPRRWRLLLLTHAAAAVCLSLGLWRWLAAPPADMGLYVDMAARRLQVFDGHGSYLWSRDGIASRELVAAVKTGETLAIAALRRASSGPVVDLFEPRTGTLVRSMPLHQLAGHGAIPLELRALPDVGTGDRLAASITTPGGQSVVVLCEGRPDGETPPRALLRSSGPHRLAGIVDVDGDSVPEIVLAGMVTRIGWYAGIAALKAEAIGDEPALTPDLTTAGGDQAGLVWYGLFPLHDLGTSQGAELGSPSLLAGARLLSVRVDVERRRLTLEYQGGRWRHVDFAGFTVGARPDGVATTGAADPERADARRRAYRFASEALRDLDAGTIGGSASPDPDGALEAARMASLRGLDEARRVSDRVLSEWAGRLRLETLARPADTGEIQALARELLPGAASPSGVAFDAARALHRAGALASAAAWYRLGSSVRGEFTSGRRTTELLEGQLLCLDEAGALDGAMTEVDRFDALTGFRLDLEPHRELVRARLSHRAPRDGRTGALALHLERTARALGREREAEALRALTPAGNR